MQRDEDVLNLCKAILEVSSNFYDNPNGAYENSCPFCYATSYTGGEQMLVGMNELNHKLDCAYLIAKDLSTGLL